jgi:inhibitor of KinA sporulation pathway (predicted exonuclease)
MNEFVSLGRFRQKCLESVYHLSLLDSKCKDLLNDVSQENVDKLANLAESYQNTTIELQNYLMDYLKEITQGNQDEISSVETDDGYVI